MNLLLVIMIGLAMMATTIGVVHVVRSSQEGQLSLHSVTSAQGTAWTGVEVLRRYLATVSATTLAGLSGPLAITGQSELSFDIIHVTKNNSANGTVIYQVVADLVGAAANTTDAASKATLQVVYDVTPAPASGTNGSGTSGSAPVSVNTINIYKNLDMTGGIKVVGGDNANLNVDGNVNLDNASITGINSIHATGNVSIGSGIHVNQVYANGDVTVTGSASVDVIDALGNVVVDGGAKPFVIQANGSVTFNGGSATSVTAIGDVNVPAGGVTIGTITTMGNVDWSGSGGSASTIHANGTVLYAGGNASTVITTTGDVTMTGGGAQSVTTAGSVTVSGYGGIGALDAQGDLNVESWVGVSGTIGGQLTLASKYMTVDVSVVPGHSVHVPTVSVTALSPVTVSRPAIDAYALQSSANYAFAMVDGAMRVTVSNVAGIDAGTYYLGGYPFANQRGYQDFLCTVLVPGTLDASGVGQCSKPAVPGHTLCQGQSTENGCLSYSGGTWTISGHSFARGVLWFQGNLVLGNGYYLDTAIATGNIATSGSFRLDSPNYAGYQEMCKNATPTGMTLDAVQKSDFDGVYPTDLCDTANQAMSGDAIGNVGLLAGGYVNGQFSGGDINIGASSVVNGSVLAGNVLNTGGSTTINGSITAGAENTSDTAPVSLSGATLIDYSKLPGGYQPGKVPCMKDCNAGDSQAGRSNLSVVVWTRYL
ncbi:hypothetical protein [Dyella sp. A6]|uniref:beta strand repeat-containing protein n=1 Tax=Dyella aluminiiresistens TaxID=3069105 RepID=UPI002E78FEA0|nr:hypothetical protein [Dyella sp. A6]